jgi:hypothetical protein
MQLYEQSQVLTIEPSTCSDMARRGSDTQELLQLRQRREALAPQEIHAAYRATCFDTGLWGSVEQGWSPEAMVAQMRGVVFQPDAYGFYSPDDMQTAQQALEDVATFLGCPDVDAYLNTVMREQEAILDRFQQPLS